MLNTKERNFRLLRRSPMNQEYRLSYSDMVEKDGQSELADVHRLIANVESWRCFTGDQRPSPLSDDYLRAPYAEVTFCSNPKRIPRDFAAKSISIPTEEVWQQFFLWCLNDTKRIFQNRKDQHPDYHDFPQLLTEARDLKQKWINSDRHTLHQGISSLQVRLKERIQDLHELANKLYQPVSEDYNFIEDGLPQSSDYYHAEKLLRLNHFTNSALGTTINEANASCVTRLICKISHRNEPDSVRGAHVTFAFLDLLARYSDWAIELDD